MRPLLHRLALIAAIGGIAILCLSSGWLAAVVGLLTAVIVVIDSLAFRRPAAPTDHEKPQRLNVDLTRRR